MTSVIPTQIAQYEILRRLGAGGMAEVFVAKKRGAEGTYKVIVLKRILPGFTSSRRFQSMFIDEAQLATRLNHPNVVQVYEFSNEGDEGHVLAMEYVEGCDLGHLMSAAKAKGRRLDPWLSGWILQEAAKGLHYAHEKRDEGGAPLDIVHRDVSPQNVLLSFDGVVKIADFGIASARLVDEEAGVLKGKFGYMSPEQARGEKVDRRSDLYALGVILWECLAGRPLHGGLGGEALLDMVRSGTVEPPSAYVRDIPEELETITMRLLAPKADDRFQTGRELSSAIARAMLARQQLVDASTLETIVGELVVREVEPAGQVEERNRTQAAAPRALGAEESTAGKAGGSAPPRPGSRRPEAREVRHVAMITLRLVELEPSNDARRKALARALERSRGMLGDMAYKRGMRWVWTSDFEARAIAGLTSKPAKAAFDAAWLAVETHEAIEAIREDLPAPVGASISIVRGIASGTRDAEGNLVRYVLHDPVSFLADVLSRTTPVSATWVAGGLYRLVRGDFRWGDAPTLELKPDVGVSNLPPNMRIYALERSLTREEKALEQANAHNDLIGRDAEKAELGAAFHATVHRGAGAGGLTTRAVVGELGIGKTALVATFLSELPPNVRLMRAECTPVRMEVPYNTLAELLRDALGFTEDETFEDAKEIVAQLLERTTQEPSLSAYAERLAEIATGRQQEGGGEDDAPYRRTILADAFRHLLGSIAREQPVVLVVEGLQWADKPTLELLAETIRSSDVMPVLFVLVTRLEDRVAFVLEGVVRVELQGLSTTEQIRLVEARLNVSEGVREVCSELMPRVGGNPFYLLEMVDALLERGVLEIEGERLVRTASTGDDLLSLPSTLEQLLADRIAELPGPERVVVDWLAIAGGPLGLADLASLNAGPALRADEDAITRLCARGLCDRKAEVLDFRHPLTRDVAYAALESLTRVRMHRALGEHLAKTSLGRGVSAAIVARHLARGDAREAAAHFYLEAAGAARAAYQPQLSVRYFGRAVNHLPDGDPRKFEAHGALEAIFRVLGRRRERRRHLDAMRKVARQSGAPRAACVALLRTARFDLDEGRLAHGLPVAKQAASLAHGLRQPNFEIEAELLVSELARELGDVQGALAAVDRALAACNPKVNPAVPLRVRAEVHRARGVLLRRVGRVTEAVEAYVEAIAVFRTSGSRRQEARAKNALAYAMVVQGRYEDAIALALESIRIDLSIGGRFQLAKTLTNIGQSYSRMGDVPRALTYLKRSRDAHERYGDQDGRADTLLVSAEVALELGEIDDAQAFLDEAATLAAVTSNAYDRTHLAAVSASLARLRRDAPTAIEFAVKARREAEQQALVAFHFFAMAVEAAARVDAGEVHSATLLATTALGAVEALQGCEYGLEIRVLCADALKRAASPQAPAARQRAVDYAFVLMNTIRDSRLRALFAKRPLVAALFDNTPVPEPVSSDRAAELSPGQG
ncbi:MAG: protein kinase [Myxococcales bacterium]|nr:protein kinase [Myxococcales bacterium]